MDAPYVIVWDLDGTLGDFGALKEEGETDRPIRVFLRPGLAEAIQELSEAGFLHTVLTLATPMYAEVVLRGTGLRDHFLQVDGLGQRMKGDAAGIAQLLNISEDDRPHRMFFVGDHPLFDEPRDPRVVFHLEPCVLSRPAGELARLVLHLRERGGGSLRRGFDDLGREPLPWWKRVLRVSDALVPDVDVTRTVASLGRLRLMTRRDGCPMIVFDDPPGQADPSPHTFIPADLAAQVRAEWGDDWHVAPDEPPA